MMLPVLAVVVAAFTRSPPLASSQVTSQGANQVFHGPGTAGAWVRVRNLRGAIEVRQTSGRNVVVTASRGFDAGSDATVRFDVRRDGANVTVCAIWPHTTRC